MPHARVPTQTYQRLICWLLFIDRLVRYENYMNTLLTSR